MIEDKFKDYDKGMVSTYLSNIHSVYMSEELFKETYLTNPSEEIKRLSDLFLKLVASDKGDILSTFYEEGLYKFEYALIEFILPGESVDNYSDVMRVLERLEQKDITLIEIYIEAYYDVRYSWDYDLYE